MDQSASKHSREAYSQKSKFIKHFQWNNSHLEHIQSSYVKLERGTVFTCHFCTRGFLDHDDLKNHQKQYYKKESNLKSNDSNNFEKPYKCGECDLRFVKESTLVTHSIIHKPFPHICECGIGYYKKCDLDAHRRLVHPMFKSVNSTVPKVKEEFNCNSKPLYKSDSEAQDCEEPEDIDDNNYKPKSRVGPRLKAKLTYKQPKKTSKNKQTRQTFKVNQENLVIKDESGLYKCPVCAKTWTAINDFNEHMNEHTGTKFNCDVCLQELPNLRKLLNHKRQHASIKDFRCTVCNKTFSAKKNVEIHMRTHTGEKPYPCTLCPKKFSQRSSLSLHLIRHSGVKMFECGDCKKRFSISDQLIRHRRIHTGERPFECKTCGKCFSDPSAFKRHLLIHTGKKPYKCIVCPKAFCDPAALFRHKRTHEGYKVPCTLCERTFKAREPMLRHIKLTHEPTKTEKKFECDHCSKKFMFKPYLVLHMQTHLKLITRVECEICEKSFYPNVLKRHIQQVHLGAFKCECEICGTIYTSKSGLKIHMMVHNKVKDNIYECDYCHASFPYKSSVAKHIVHKHLGIKCKMCNKTFVTTHRLRLHKAKGCIRCSVCQMAFRTNTKLKHHFLLHLPKSERQVFECDYCNKQYSMKETLRRHIRDVHNSKGLNAKLTCGHCKETFSKRNVIRNHIWNKHMVSLYCNVCLKRFYNEYEFKQHKRAGCLLKQLSCDICELKFPSVTRLKSHLLAHGPKKLECDLCGFKCKHRSILKRHVMAHFG